jgi:hypothetical protein
MSFMKPKSAVSQRPAQPDRSAYPFDRFQDFAGAVADG